MIHLKSISLFILLVFSFHFSHAGIHIRTSDGDNYSQDTEDNYYQNNIMVNKGDTHLIVDFNKKTLTEINHSKQNYFSISFNDFNDSFNGDNEAMIEEALKQVPEAQRETMRQMYEKMYAEMKKPYEAEVQIKKESDSKNILGKNCSHYSVYENDILVEEIYIASGYNPEKINEKAIEFSSIIPVKDYSNTSEYMELHKKGMIMEKKNIEENTIYKVIQIEKISVDPSLMKIPDSYTKMDMQSYYNQ